MNRSMFKTLGKVILGLSFAFALSTVNLGCHKGCDPCRTSKDPCKVGCAKPCCAKVERTVSPCAAGCTKPCCKRS